MSAICPKCGAPKKLNITDLLVFGAAVYCGCDGFTVSQMLSSMQSSGDVYGVGPGQAALASLFPERQHAGRVKEGHSAAVSP